MPLRICVMGEFRNCDAVFMVGTLSRDALSALWEMRGPKGEKAFGELADCAGATATGLEGVRAACISFKRLENMPSARARCLLQEVLHSAR
jgi:ABC-type transporter Mla MlaB component|mmetsp:Transcript_66775/g.149037  ORF Transcript_66775/g.149037 Transcript_66775/m.149037 type:complete len:91 (+) Transcript_66775:3182-3454(+)